MNGITTDEMREDYIWRNRPRPTEESAAEFDAWIDNVRAGAHDELRADLAEEVANYADATYDLIDSPNGARLAFEYIAETIRGDDR